MVVASPAKRKERNRPRRNNMPREDSSSIFASQTEIDVGEINNNESEKNLSEIATSRSQNEDKRQESSPISLESPLNLDLGWSRNEIKIE